MAEFLLTLPLAALFWWLVLFRIIPQLRARELMDDVIPEAWEVAAAEKELPEVRDGWVL